ncbi:MAG: hypothetical protein ACXWV9_07235 [Flavisolibacter sp.]
MVEKNHKKETVLLVEFYKVGSGKPKPGPEKSYREWFKSKKDFEPDEVQFVKVDESTWVANLMSV